MCWIEIFFYLFLLYLLVQCVRLAVADADLALMWKERFGLKPESLKGQVVWITGASSGIGECLSYDLARAGCKLVLSARREDELQRVKKQCLLSGKVTDEEILVLPLDLLKTDTHAQAVEDVISYFKQIDILVNNGGRSQRSWIADTVLEVHREMIDLNVIGTISMTKAVLPYMVKRKSGHMVVTSSVAGKMGVPISGCYAATKHAVQGYYDSLRVEMSRNNIAVTTVCPGPIQTDINLHAFVGEQGKSFAQNIPGIDEKRMTTARCSHLMATAIANRVMETWIAKHPILLFTYLAQYMPNFFKWTGTILGLRVLDKIRHRMSDEASR